MKDWSYVKRSVFRSLTLFGIAAGFAVLPLSRLFHPHQSVEAGSSARDCAPEVYSVGQVEAALSFSQAFTYQHIGAEEAREKACFEARLRSNRLRVDQVYRAYEKTITRKKDRELFADLQSCCAPYRRIQDEVIALSRQLQHQEALDLAKRKLEPCCTRYLNAARALTAYNLRSADFFAFAGAMPVR